MMDIGKMIKEMEKDLHIIKIIIYIRVVGKTIKPEIQPGYKFLQGKDTSTTDVGNKTSLKNNIDKLKKWCDENPKCAGFNSNGWMKGSIGKIKTVKGFTKPHQGLYIKNNI